MGQKTNAAILLAAKINLGMFCWDWFC